MQLDRRTLIHTPTRTPTSILQGCFSLLGIVIKPLKNLRISFSLIVRDIPFFSSSPVATTPKTLA